MDAVTGRRVWRDVAEVYKRKGKLTPDLFRFVLELSCGHRVGRHLLRPAGVGPERVPCFRCTRG